MDAIIFDFDGLLVDTETPLFRAWVETYEHFGVGPIDIADWRTSIGLHEADPARFDPLERLTSILGTAVTVDEIQAHRRRVRDGYLKGAGLRPGASVLLDAAQQAGVPVGIASSSPPHWIRQHLEPLGLLQRFSVLSCAVDGRPGKPHPATYQHACQELGVEPSRTLALEDSPNGVVAARAAGLHCIAVPNPTTAGCSFDRAHHLVSSLEAIDLSHSTAETGRGRRRGCPLCVRPNHQTRRPGRRPSVRTAREP